MTLTRARKNLRTRRAKYAVGYSTAGNFLYATSGGMVVPTSFRPNGHSTILPMTLREAREFLKSMPSAGACIFEIRAIAVNR